MASNPFLTQAPLQTMGVTPEAAQLQRQQQFAAMLMNQGQQPQGQMVSGRFVAPSWTQQLQSLVNPMIGGYMANEADKRALALQTAQDRAAQENIFSALKTMRGTPEEIVYGAGMEGPTKETKAAVVGDKEKALAMLLRPNRTALETNLAGKILEQQWKDPKWEKDVRYINGQEVHGWTNVNDPSLPFSAGTAKPQLSQKDIMQGTYEGWYNPRLNPAAGLQSNNMPTVGASINGAPASGVSMGGTLVAGPAMSVGGMSPQKMGEASKEVFVDKMKRQQEYAEKAPAAIEQMKSTIQSVNDLIGDLQVDASGKLLPLQKGQKAPHEGFENAVGLSSGPLAQFIPASPTRNFIERFKQVGGQTFMQAFENLKGAGQITEVEGTKATAALNRMNLAQSEAEFVQAAREFEQNLIKGMDLARKRAGMPAEQGTWRVKK